MLSFPSKPGAEYKSKNRTRYVSARVGRDSANTAPVSAETMPELLIPGRNQVQLQNGGGELHLKPKQQTLLKSTIEVKLTSPEQILRHYIQACLNKN